MCRDAACGDGVGVEAVVEHVGELLRCIVVMARAARAGLLRAAVLTMNGAVGGAARGARASGEGGGCGRTA